MNTNVKYDYSLNRVNFKENKFVKFETNNHYVICLNKSDFDNSKKLFFYNLDVSTIINLKFLKEQLIKDNVFYLYNNDINYLFCLFDSVDLNNSQDGELNKSEQNVKSFLFEQITSEHSSNFEKMKKIVQKIADFIFQFDLDDLYVLFENTSSDFMYYLMYFLNNAYYKFDKYIKQNKNLNIHFHANNNPICDIDKFINTVQNVADGKIIMNNLCFEAPNVLYPENYANIVNDIFKNHQNIKVTTIDYDKMLELNMGGICGVGQGSVKKPCAVIIEYNGDTSSTQYSHSLIGKGVTFDSGGISIKPANNMDKMKHDMAGSAAVVGAMYLLSKNNQVKKNVVAMIGLAENMPGGNALKPSDIITMMSGDTVEVLNTDAEGRLVLADLMHYIQKHYNVSEMVDIATLTGAIQYAVGDKYIGLFSNKEEMYNKMIKIGHQTNQKVWPFPVVGYEKHIKSDVADIKNISSKYTGAGSITAAAFLHHFVKDNAKLKWTHLDIAGVLHEFDYNYLCEYIAKSN